MINDNLEVKYIAIDNIKPYERNARIHLDKHIDEIVNSIKVFDFINPILLDENNIILAGHGRWLAGKKLNIDKVPCIKIDYLNEAQKKAYRIADNKLTMNGSWDENLLGLEFKNLSELNLDFDLNVTGFSLPEIDFAIQSLDKPIENDPADEIPEIDENNIISKEGDLWKLDKHIIYCGNGKIQHEEFAMASGEMNSEEFTDFLKKAFTNLKNFSLC